MNGSLLIAAASSTPLLPSAANRATLQQASRSLPLEEMSTLLRDSDFGICFRVWQSCSARCLCYDPVERCWRKHFRDQFPMVRGRDFRSVRFLTRWSGITQAIRRARRGGAGRPRGHRPLDRRWHDDLGISALPDTAVARIDLRLASSRLHANDGGALSRRASPLLRKLSTRLAQGA